MRVLEGRIAIVTGGASGIGRATVLAMAEAGAKVVVADVDAEGAERVVSDTRARGGEADAIATDIGDHGQLERMVRFTLERHGRIDILDNNAAALKLIPRDLDLLEGQIDAWESTLRVNALGPMVACRLVLPHMLAQGGGVIINVSSVSSIRGETGHFAYGMSKAAVNALTLNIAATYSKRGIRCNAILPGFVLTDYARTRIGEPQRAVWEAHISTPFIGSPEHIAGVAVFLASDAAAYVNGELMRVDGGLLSHAPQLAQMNALRRPPPP